MEQVDKNQTIDETKRKLQATREKLEGELEYQLQDIQGDLKNMGKNILIYAGGAYAAYRLLKALTGSKKKDKGKKVVYKEKVESSGFAKELLYQTLATIITISLQKQFKKVKQGANTPHEGKNSIT